jgi:hypothetical protein
MYLIYNDCRNSVFWHLLPFGLEKTGRRSLSVISRTAQDSLSHLLGQRNARPTIRLPNDQVNVANVICFMKVRLLLGWECTFLGAYFFLWCKVLCFGRKCEFCYPGRSSAL